MSASYPNFVLRDDTTKVYMRLLADIPPEVLEAAALECITKSEFFPTVAKVREAAMNLMLNKAALPSAFEAWAEVCKEIRRVGYAGKPEFSTPLIEKAVQGIGGWRYICLSEDGVADRARFFQGYDILMQRAEAQAKMLPEVRHVAERLAAGKVPGIPHLELVDGREKNGKQGVA